MGVHLMNREFRLFAVVVAMVFALSCHRAPPANVAAEVNGHAITYSQLEKTYQSQYSQQPEAANQFHGLYSVKGDRYTPDS